jgi:hypothetical protein
MFQEEERDDKKDHSDDIAKLPEIERLFDELDKQREEGQKGAVGEKQKQQAIDEVVEETPEPEEDSEQAESEVEAGEEAEEEDFEEEPAAPEEKPKKKGWQVRDERYALRAKLKAQEEENARLRAAMEESINSEAFYYGKNVFSDLDRAKSIYKAALEDGDANAAVEAQVAITNAQYKVNKLEDWVNAQEQRKQYVSRAQPPIEQVNNASQDDATEAYQEVVSDWLQKHPYLKNDSRNYDPKLTKQVTEFADALDFKYSRNNQGHKIGMPSYFNEIDKHISSLRAQQSSKNLKSLPNVGSVKGSYAPKTKTADPATDFNELDLDIMEEWGIPAKKFAAYKKKHMQ